MKKTFYTLVAVVVGSILIVVFALSGQIAALMRTAGGM